METVTRYRVVLSGCVLVTHIILIKYLSRYNANIIIRKEIFIIIPLSDLIFLPAHCSVLYPNYSVPSLKLWTSHYCKHKYQVGVHRCIWCVCCLMNSLNYGVPWCGCFLTSMRRVVSG